MSIIWIGRRFLPLFIACWALDPSLALAQKRGGSAGGSGAPGGGAATSTPPASSPFPGNNTNNSPNTNNPRNPNNFPQNSPSSPGFATPIFLSGRVMFDDGSAPNPNMRIERVCGTMTRLETHTDSKGRFNFQVGQNSGVDTDASDSASPSFGNMGSGSGMNRSGFGESMNLSNCELRASFPGYRSDFVSLSQHRALDNPEIGTIILHRLTNVQGTTMSATTLMAPRHAQKAYEKGMQLAAKGKFDDAEERFTEATGLYPKYAIAWFALGEIDQREGKAEDARKDYKAAIAADSKYVSPYDQLALLSVQEGKWQDAAEFSRNAISLNPVEFPSSLWYNAIANYNLKKLADSEKSVRQLLESDSSHRYPGAENLLAGILLDKGNLAEAAVHMRAYLKLQPNAKNAAMVKETLDRIDQQSAQAKK
jgi:Tfp pilus assembly protein PilF